MADDIRLEAAADVQAFEKTVGHFLRAREAENCVMLGLCSQMRAGTASIPSVSPYFAVTRSGDTIVGAALIAGFLVVLSSPIDDDALPTLVADIARSVPGVPGVVGESGASRRFAELWTSVTGRPHNLKMSERILRIERVIPPLAVEGQIRTADRSDRDLLARWLVAFNNDALGQSADSAAMATFADRWISRQGRTMYLWVVDGRPVSMVGVSGETPHGIRVAPVYTPVELRGRGYASALTAAATQRQFDEGKRYCFLFTDLANPTSNHIYQAIGYEKVSDVEDYRFDRPASELNQY